MFIIASNIHRVENNNYLQQKNSFSHLWCVKETKNSTDAQKLSTPAWLVPVKSVVPFRYIVSCGNESFAVSTRKWRMNRKHQKNQLQEGPVESLDVPMQQTNRKVSWKEVDDRECDYH